MTQQPTAPPPAAPPAGANLPKGAAIGSMVCGIISLCTGCLPVAPLALGIIATALGAIGMKKANQGVGGGQGLAIAGLICGIIGIVWGVFMTIYWFTVGALFWGAAS